MRRFWLTRVGGYSYMYVGSPPIQSYVGWHAERWKVRERADIKALGMAWGQTMIDKGRQDICNAKSLTVWCNLLSVLSSGCLLVTPSGQLACYHQGLGVILILPALGWSLCALYILHLLGFNKVELVNGLLFSDNHLHACTHACTWQDHMFTIPLLKLLLWVHLQC